MVVFEGFVRNTFVRLWQVSASMWKKETVFGVRYQLRTIWYRTPTISICSGDSGQQTNYIFGLESSFLVDEL